MTSLNRFLHSLRSVGMTGGGGDAQGAQAHPSGSNLPTTPTKAGAEAVLVDAGDPGSRLAGIRREELKNQRNTHGFYKTGPQEKESPRPWGRGETVKADSSTLRRCSGQASLGMRGRVLLERHTFFGLAIPSSRGGPSRCVALARRGR